MPLTDDFAKITFTGAKGATNDTSAQTVVPDPGSGQNVYVVDKRNLSVVNEDTVSVTIIVRLTGGTSRIVERCTLVVGDHYVNPARIVISPGETLTIELAATVTTSQSPWSVAYFQVTN